MGFPLDLALRYMRSRKRAFISVGTAFAIIGVCLGTTALSTVLSVTGGFRAEFREKVLGVNAHVLVLKYASDFPEYREVMKKMETVPHVIGIAPFVINPMMITHGDRTATGVLLKGVDPDRLAQVLDLPRHMVEGSLAGLRVPGAKPPERKHALIDPDLPRISPLAPPRHTAPSPSSSAATEDLDEAIQELLEKSDKKRAGAPEAAAASASAAPEPSGRAPGEGERTAEADGGAPLQVAEGAPIGDVKPAGGYASVLPDDADIPDEVDPDPCKDARATAKMPGIVLGATLRKTLGVNVGDCLQVTSPTIGFSFAGGAMHPPVAKQFRVTGIFEAGFDQYDSKLVYTDLYEAQAFYDGGDTVTGVEMKVDDIDGARRISQAVSDKLNNSIYHVLDWEQLNHGLFTALRIQQILMSLVIALIMVVAAFAVIATLIMVVLDKKREIAVLKAMGATDWGLLRSFLYQGLIMGVMGATTGLGLGYVVCRWILVYGFPLDPKVYFISRLPVAMHPIEFALTGVFAILVCLVATLWPAMYASRLRPAEGFREQ
ncbi:MAG TPA: ABC transporter permease [Polyangiaceae bacterium]|nr:ABC transporter permease [Polyangiaceae bacterium]